MSTDMGRIISKDRIRREEETERDEDGYVLDEDGNIIEGEAPIKPIAELEFAMYFQYRIDKIDEDNYRYPKIIIGLCRDEFKQYMDLSKTQDVWAMNLATGDKFFNRKWKNYYDLDRDIPKHGYFEEGSIVGIFIDLERGIMSFYKDGRDLGQAFVHHRLKNCALFPFIQTNCECELSIFHPAVHPAYRPPEPENEDMGEY